jgi:steroid delta-isomerase
VAHLLSLRSEFDNGVSSTVRGIFTYRVDDDGKLVSLRGYWTMDDMVFDQPEG